MPKYHFYIQVPSALEDRQETKELSGPLETRASLEKWAGKEPRERTVPWDWLVLQVLLDLKVTYFDIFNIFGGYRS